MRPRLLRVHFYYARFLHGHNRPGEALPLLAKAVESSPSFSEARCLLMRIYAQQHDWKALGAAVEETLKLSPEDTAARVYREVVLNSADLLRVQEVATKIDPTTYNYLRLSLAYYGNHQFGKCIEASRGALKLRPNYFQAYNNTCIACVQLGKRAPAIAASESALAIDTHFGLARNNLASARARIRRDCPLNRSVPQSSGETQPPASQRIEIPGSDPVPDSIRDPGQAQVCGIAAFACPEPAEEIFLGSLCPESSVQPKTPQTGAEEQ